MRVLAMVLLNLTLWILPVQAQLWSGIIDSKRAIDWSVSAGIPGGVPNRTVICTTLDPGATVAQINSAISACGTNQVVFLNAGTYNLTGKILFNRNDMVLRGAGADQTKLVFSGNGGCGNGSCVVHFSKNGQWSGGPQFTATFLGAGNPPVSGTYTQGATQLLVSSNANMAVGQVLILDQLNDAADTGNVYICGFTGATCSSEGASAGGGRGDNHALMQFAEITGINGTTITVRQPLYMPTWRTSQSPGVWWTSSPQKNAGIENVTIDARNSGAQFVIVFENAHYCWAKGVTSLKANGGRAHVEQQYSSGNVVRDSYLFGTQGSSLSYGSETWMSGNTLVENNIFEEGVTAMIIGAGAGSVYAYNYMFNEISNNPGWLYPTIMDHDPGTVMNLIEGNIVHNIMQDSIHGSHAMDTYFRNRASGFDDTQTMQTVPFLFESFSRYANIIGNVLGRSGYHNNYQSTSSGSSTNCNTSIFNIAWGSTGCSAGGMNNDPLTLTTMMRWGNYDVVTGTVRWCGNSSSTGWSTTCASTSEVPTGAPVYPNAVPATETLPNSFYLSAQPTAWWTTPWGTPHWPPIGPDVTGGTISEGSGGEAGLDGHAYKLPAQLCYENTSTTGGIKNFNAAACYIGGGADVIPPAAPQNLKIL